MRILRHFETIPADARGGVVVLGNFDGVHRGHQAVVGAAAADAVRLKAPLVVVTFEPHPRRFFRPDDPPFRLTPFRSKVIQLAALGVDVVLVLAFGRAMSQMPAEDFVRKVLIGGLAPRQITIGYDFHFGHQRQGNPALLERLLPAGNGCAVKVVQPVASADGEVYSSTRIREFLTAGKPGHAAALLGRPFEIEGRVERGDRRAPGSATARRRNGSMPSPTSASGRPLAARSCCSKPTCSTSSATSTASISASP
jgi:riboflavin kinase/FMN adenylyltransferase